MKEKFQQWMKQRYGSDELSRALAWLTLGCTGFYLVTDNKIFQTLSSVTVVVLLFRILSSNFLQRRRENQKFLDMVAPIRKKISLQKRKWKDRKTYRYVTCSECGKLLRVPKGKGKLKVKCGHCHHSFTMKS